MEFEKHLQNGNTFLSMPVYDKAAEAFHKAISENPNDYRGWFGLATAMSDKFSTFNDNHAETLQNLERAISAAPSDKKQEIEAQYIEYKLVCLLGLKNGVITCYRGTLKDIMLPLNAVEIAERAFTEFVPFTPAEKQELQSVYMGGSYGSNLTLSNVFGAFNDYGDFKKGNRDWMLDALFVGGVYNGAEIESVKIPASVVRTRKDIFASCTSLKSVVFEEGSRLTHIGKGAFYRTVIKDIIIPPYVTGIDDGAFLQCYNLVTMVVPLTVRKIGISAFKDCSSLTNITLPNSLTEIGEAAFSRFGASTFKIFDSNLASITIPDSVISVGRQAFAGWKKRQTVYVNKKQSKRWDKNWIQFCKAKIVYR